jgi:ABC-2 type transport system permease protein
VTKLIAAEILKLRTTRTFWVLVGISLALVALSCIAQMASDAPDDGEEFRALIATAGTAGLLALILGVVSSAGEYRHGTITSTFLVAPDRARVLIAKTLAGGLAGLVLALLSLLLVLAIAMPWLGADSESLGSIGVGTSELLGAAAEATAYVVLTAMIAVAIGALLTNQVAALAVVPLLLILVDPLLTLLTEGYAKFSLSGIWASLGGETSEDTGFAVFDPLAAGLIYLGYVAVLVAVTAAIDRRRDVA